MRLISVRWDGETFRPWRRHEKECAERFVIGADYTVEQQEPRSAASHSHYFAALTEAWRNLPEDQAERFPTVEHFRKWLLIRAGYRDERTHACASKAEALRFSAFIKPIDEFAVVIAKEAVVSVYTAKSQSARAMGKKEFQESKDAVLSLAAEMIGVTPAQVEHNAREVA